MLDNRLVEIRWHGRGGQGVVTAGELLAFAAMHENKFFQSFPEFGAERSGAPVSAYTRLSGQPINVQSAVTEPDIVVVLDSSLLGTVDTFQGLNRTNGLAVVNSPAPPEELQQKYDLTEARVCTVDANRIAGELLPTVVPNVPMLGALLRATGLVSVKEMMRAIHERLGRNLPHEVARANLAALKQGYRQTKLAPAVSAKTPKGDEPAHLVSGFGESWRELPEGAVVTQPGSSRETDTGTWRADIPLIDLGKCTHCMICWIYCPDDSILVEDRRVQGVDLVHCKGCGICALECPAGAITMDVQVAQA